MELVDSELLEPEARGLTPGDPAYLRMTAECQNPDCPGKEVDMAKATGPDGSQS